MSSVESKQPSDCPSPAVSLAHHTEYGLGRLAVGTGRSVLGVTSLSALNIVVGFILQVVLAAKFGTGVEMDAYLAATSIPALLTIVLLGALNVTLVPVFVDYKVKGNESEARQVLSGFFNLGILVLGAVVLLGIVAAPWLVRVTTPGFQMGSQPFDLAVRLLKILCPSVLFSGLAGLLGSVYQARQEFARPTLAPVLNNGLIVASTLALSGHLGVVSVAVGTVIGAFGQFVLLIPILLRERGYSLYFNARHPGIRRVLVLMLPWIAGALVYKANPLIDRFVASQLPSGSISVLGYAYRFVTVMVTLMTQGISIVLFPLLSRYAAMHDVKKLRATALTGIRMILFITIPVSVGLIILREPLIRLLFERGEFTSQATRDTGRALLGYLGALLATSIGTVLTYVFYALQDTRTPVKVGIAGVCINVILALALTHRFGYMGPAIAYSLATLFNLIVLMVILRARLAGFNGRREGRTLARMIGAALLSGSVLCLMGWLTRDLHSVSIAFEAATTAGIVATGAVTYLGLAYLFGISEAKLLVQGARYCVSDVIRYARALARLV